MARWAHENTFDDAVLTAQRAFPSVPVSVIKGVIAAESGFRQDAIRGEPQRGDASYGLMQLTYNTARALGYGGTRENLLIPAINIYYGTKLLADLYSKLRDWDAVFSAYNGGIRPELGFGGRLTGSRSKRICLRWSQVVPGQCEKWHTVQPGEFANVAYVDKVKRHTAYFATRPLGEGGQQAPFRPERNATATDSTSRGRAVARTGPEDLNRRGIVARLWEVIRALF